MLNACYRDQDGHRYCPRQVESNSKNKFEKLVLLVGFIISIYHDARSSQCQIQNAASLKIWWSGSFKLHNDLDIHHCVQTTESGITTSFMFHFNIILKYVFFYNFFSQVFPFCLGYTHFSFPSFVAYVSHIVWYLTLYLLTWRIWWVPNNAGKGQIGFYSAFKGLMWSP